MALRIRFAYPARAHLAYSIERLADGFKYDFASGSFVVTPNLAYATLPEGTWFTAGSYQATLDPTPKGTFPDGDYVVTVHDSDASGMVVAHLGTTMQGGDDASLGPRGAGA